MEITVSARLSLQAVPFLSPLTSGAAGTTRIPWLVDVPLTSLGLSSRSVLPRLLAPSPFRAILRLHLFPSYKTSCSGVGPPCWPRLSPTTSAKVLLPNKGTLTGPGGKELQPTLWGDTIRPMIHSSLYFSFTVSSPVCHCTLIM